MGSKSDNNERIHIQRHFLNKPPLKAGSQLFNPGGGNHRKLRRHGVTVGRAGSLLTRDRFINLCHQIEDSVGRRDRHAYRMVAERSPQIFVMQPATPQLAAPLPAAPSPAANQLPAANYIDEQRGPGIGDVLTAPSHATH